MTSAAVAVLAGLDAIRDRQEDLYRNLHQHPELSHQERHTATVVGERLRQAGFSVHGGIGGNGVVGVLTNGDGPPCCCGPTWTRCRCGRGPVWPTPAPLSARTRTASRCR